MGGLLHFKRLAPILAALACSQVAGAQVLTTTSGAPFTVGGAPFLLSGSGPPPPSGLQAAGFPRTAVLLYGGVFAGLYSGNIAGCNQTMATIASQSSLVIIGFYYGVEQAYGTYPTLMSGWKTAAAANGLTLYTTIYTAGQGFYWEGTTTPWLSAAFNDGSMWLYNSSAGSGTTDLSTYTGSASQSWLNITTTNTQTIPTTTINGKTNVLLGYNLWSAYAQYFTDSLMNGLAVSKYGEDNSMASNSYLSGFFIDNTAPWGTAGTATYNGLGTTPVANSNAVATITQEGDAYLPGAFKVLNSNTILIGNTGYAYGYLSGKFSSTATSYLGLWDAILNEGAIGSTAGVEYLYNSTPGQWMSGMIASEASLNANGVELFHQVGKPDGVAFSATSQASWTTGTGGDWQAARFGIAAAMMRNSYYILNPGGESYNSVGLMDEMYQGGSYAWLSNGSQRLDAPQSTSWSNGVWRRRFPNGWVLWNPRGNGVQTVTVPTTLFRLTNRGSSYGDSGVNNGAQVSGGTVTLQDADGLFLIGTG